MALGNMAKTGADVDGPLRITAWLRRRAGVLLLRRANGGCVGRADRGCVVMDDAPLTLTKTCESERDAFPHGHA